MVTGRAEVGQGGDPVLACVRMQHDGHQGRGGRQQDGAAMDAVEYRQALGGDLPR
jgi:hypothetical protein